MVSRPSPVEAAVFISGVSSMGLEMVAGRLLAPEFGSSVYTWGSIIGVFMAALALGYHYGGKASADATRRSISVYFMVAAAFTAALVFLGSEGVTVWRSLPLGPRYLPLFPATFLFGPPAFFLGFVSPYAAQLSGASGKGEASGRVYALGTAGSIAGTFAATFVLIPFLSVPEVLAVLAGTSVLGAAVASIRTDEIQLIAGSGAALLLLLTLGMVLQSQSASAVYSTETSYQHLEIRDSDGVRTMYLDGHPQSAAYLNGSLNYPWKYTRYFHLPLLMGDEPVEKVLFIGAGGFSGPRRFAHEYNASIDVVEIDPGVVEAGMKYFNASSTAGMDVVVGDGRRYLRRTDTSYDLVVVDAYRRSSVPFHLTTVEFLELVDRRLDQDGAVHMNLISAPEGPGSRFYRAEHRTASQVFPSVYGFRTSDSSGVQNMQLIASKDEKLSQRQLRERNRERKVGLNLSEEIDSIMPQPYSSDVPVLRDEKAPVDRLTDPMLGTEYVIEGRESTEY